MELIVNWLLTHAPTEISVSALIGVLAIGAVAALGAWWLRGYIDKEKLDARDERLLLARDRQEETTRKLTEATETIAQLQRQIGEGQPAKVVKSVEKVRLAIQNATTANTALGSSLVPVPPPPRFFHSPPSHSAVTQGSTFTTYSTPDDTPEIKMAKKALDQKKSGA
jgi:hypothetical protein